MTQELSDQPDGNPQPGEPLEDEASDILGKAARGLGRLSPPDEDDADLIASADQLGIDPLRLLAIAHQQYRPNVTAPHGIVRFKSHYLALDMDVNSYLAFDPTSRTAVAFDTGADSSALFDFIARQNLSLAALFITHTHPDHIADLDRFGSIETFTPAGEPLPGTRTIAPGEALEFGRLKIEARLTSGHSPGGLTYVVHGLENTAAVVGDAIFAGSIGGPKISYDDARNHLRTQVFTLPPETILCPGHGPLTTVALERSHNPFFPDLS